MYTKTTQFFKKPTVDKIDTGKKIQITQKKAGKGKERDRKKRKQVENK